MFVCLFALWTGEEGLEDPLGGSGGDEEDVATDTLAGIDPLLLIAERVRKSLDHADDLSKDMHKYGPEALEEINHKIDTTVKDTIVGSGVAWLVKHWLSTDTVTSAQLRFASAELAELLEYRLQHS